MALSSLTISRAFVEGLMADGLATVAAFEAATAPIIDDSAKEVIAEREAMARLDLAGDAPSLDADAAEWALMQFYRFCQLLVSRDTPAEIVTAVVATSYPLKLTSAIAYSADLFFQYVPEIYRRAHQAAPDDALVSALKTWAAQWPLSSVGISLDTPPPLDLIAPDTALWRLYLDRAAAAHASDRWADPRVASQLRSDLGAYTELAPSIAAALDRLSLSSNSFAS